MSEKQRHLSIVPDQAIDGMAKLNKEAEPLDSISNYVNNILGHNQRKYPPYTVINKSIDDTFLLSTQIVPTYNRYGFESNGILIAIISISYIDDAENNKDDVMKHDRFELRQVKGVVDLYRRTIDDEIIHKPCSSDEKELLAIAISMLSAEG